MAKTKAQKQKDYIECLKTKYRAADLESEPKQKKKKLEQLQKDEAAYNLHLPKKKLNPSSPYNAKLALKIRHCKKPKFKTMTAKEEKAS